MTAIKGEEMSASERPIGRCIGCFHDFNTGPCGGCGAEPRPCGPCAGTGNGYAKVDAGWFETDCAHCDGSGYAEPLTVLR
jgi:hypothetical protein